MIAKATNTATGEVFELKVIDFKTLVSAYSAAQEYEKMAKSLKNQLKDMLDDYIDDSGKSEEWNGKQFKRSTIQRMTYDKAVLRKVLDEDTFDLMLKPEKSKVDQYIKENLDTLGEDSTLLRKTMVPDGDPYQQVKLEKLVRDK